MSGGLPLVVTCKLVALDDGFRRSCVAVLTPGDLGDWGCDVGKKRLRCTDVNVDWRSRSAAGRGLREICAHDSPRPSISSLRSPLSLYHSPEAKVSTTMVERTGEAYLAIEVVEYFFGTGDRINAPTWRGMEGWNRRYANNWGTIQCTGLCDLMPDISIQLQFSLRPLPPT
jgi:hypothetical protein